MVDLREFAEKRYHPGAPRGWPHFQVATGDVDDFFASLSRQRLLELLRHQVWETPILNLLEAYLHIGTTNRQFAWDDTGKGIAQGSPLSPMLSDLYLAGFDQHLQASTLTV